MKIIQKDPSIMSLMLPSTIQDAERYVDFFEAYLKEQGFSRPLKASVLFRELLLNAMQHGNGRLGEKEVRVEVEALSGNRYRIMMEDGGNGFNYKALDMRLPVVPGKVRNRGLALINALSEKVSFNERGNRVEAVICVEDDLTGLPHSSHLSRGSPLPRGPG